MHKEEFKRQVRECGDAIITYRSPKSSKQKYNVCTLDFTTAYIQKKSTRTNEDEDTVLLFCWDTDSYRLIRFRNVISIVPLSNILKNGNI